ncbi:putative O-antigen acetylase [Sphingomonas sp. RIT328]|nr:putative O-antigen acetylase [Sphingomonas sp. RIT328]
MVREGFKPELQGLRAVAVLLVLVFHLDPAWLSGGYVGVDAFFVLSGYFITTALVGDLERTGGIDLIGFYARRFRRLLPAAALVLAAMLVGIAAFPQDQWPHIAREVAAAALYVENLFLAHHAVDYLAFDRVASPVQHYWSLSVEEQFYLVWPVILLGAAQLRRAIAWPVRRLVTGTIVVALLGSLGLSITAGHAPGSYFHPQLRVWELAMGGLVACLPGWSNRVARGRHAVAVQGAGLVLLTGAAIGYSATTVFPGYAALVPTFGAALVILAAQADRGRNRLLDNPAMRWIGDRSYAIYLWHWPIIVAVRYRSDGQLGLFDMVGILIVVLLLAELTKRLVEDRFRLHGRGRAGVRSFVPVAIAIAVPLLLAGALLGYVAWDRHRFERAQLDPRVYPGAAALTGAPVPAAPVFPAAHLVPLDIPSVYADGCSLPFGASAIRACPAGVLRSATTIAVVGDSHAAQWLPAFDRAGQRRGWRIVPLTKSSCPLVATRMVHADAASCAVWARNVLATLAAHPPAVIVYALYLDGEVGQLADDDARLAAIRPMLVRLAALGSRVIVLRDTPHLSVDPIAALDRPAQPVLLPRVARRSDMLRTAAQASGVPMLDLDDWICPRGQCRTVIGNLVVWRDDHHITAHYAATLAAPLADRLARLLPHPCPRTGAAACP